ncbi:hypothetical protein VKT23_019547 [Stygiomarasmius scandens]|uniref:Uncharacterized protein n=1 Tax=Marasmiellus scandens TaxID=2682957 RepID=A0ABR1IQF0_9AGAR
MYKFLSHTLLFPPAIVSLHFPTVRLRYLNSSTITLVPIKQGRILLRHRTLDHQACIAYPIHALYPTFILPHQLSPSPPNAMEPRDALCKLQCTCVQFAQQRGALR